MYWKQIQISAFSGLLFYIISNPKTYDIIQRIVEEIGDIKLTINGNPTELGLLIHSVLFSLITFVSMQIK
jgi:hypothetical protein